MQIYGRPHTLCYYVRIKPLAHLTCNEGIHPVYILYWKYDIGTTFKLKL